MKGTVLWQLIYSVFVHSSNSSTSLQIFLVLALTLCLMDKWVVRMLRKSKGFFSLFFLCYWRVDMRWDHPNIIYRNSLASSLTAWWALMLWEEKRKRLSNRSVSQQWLRPYQTVLMIRAAVIRSDPMVPWYTNPPPWHIFRFPCRSFFHFTTQSWCFSSAVMSPVFLLIHFFNLYTE